MRSPLRMSRSGLGVLAGVLAGWGDSAAGCAREEGVALSWVWALRVEMDAEETPQRATKSVRSRLETEAMLEDGANRQERIGRGLISASAPSGGRFDENRKRRNARGRDFWGAGRKISGSVCDSKKFGLNGLVRVFRCIFGIHFGGNMRTRDR